LPTIGRSSSPSSERLLGFSPQEHPLALQLGGSEPDKLAAAAVVAAELGYDESNLNVGCPSDRVQSGTFGACLMRSPALVGECVAAMKTAVAVPVTVKCRLGVDDQDPGAALDTFADAVIAAGADCIWVHARKAWLAGLSPKENRDIPTLDYDRVYRLKRVQDQRARQGQMGRRRVRRAPFSAKAATSEITARRVTRRRSRVLVLCVIGVFLPSAGEWQIAHG
jgi:tRNA dihydrouridine synthase A